MDKTQATYAGTSTLQSAIRLHGIRSPLAKTSFRLHPGAACLLRLESGEATVISDFPVTIVAPRLVWLAARHRGELCLSPGSRGELLHLGDVAIAGALPPGAFGAELHRGFRQDCFAPLEVKDSRLTLLFDALQQELLGNEPGATFAVSNILSLLLIQLWRGAKVSPVRSGETLGGIAQEFFRLADLHLLDHWHVADYATALGVTREQLGSSVRRTTGKSPQAWLHQRLHEEAISLLTGSDLQIAEVGFRLGYADPAYFNRVFKRMEGLSPRRYRIRALKRTESPNSYAAWP